ncbi:MAG: site-specific integrase [Pseudomonadota bacterium]
MAGVYKRGSVYWGRVTRGGREFRRSLKTASRDTAEKRLAAWIDDMEAVAWGDKPPILFADAAFDFLTEHGAALRPESLRRYRTSVKALHPHFEGRTMQSIGRAEMAEFEVTRRREGVTASSIRRDLACLSSIFTFCIERERVEVNPVPAFMKMRSRRGLKESPPRDRYLSHEEEGKLLAAADPALRVQIAFAIDTGLRLGEQFGLTWSNVDLKAGMIYVAESKSGRPRRVPLLERSRTNLGTLPRHISSPFVFHQPGAGKPYDRRTRPLETARKRAKISTLQWHDLRRTCGCRLLQDHGLDLYEVSKWLGHANVTVTQASYAFLATDQLSRKVQPKSAAQNPAQDTGI